MSTEIVTATIPATDRAPMTDRELLESIRADLDEFRALVTPIIAEVVPTINALTDSPMLKMFLPKKKG